jgi:predicted PurR-regulated permease PerM
MIMDPDQKFNLAGTIVLILAALLAAYLTKDVFAPFLLSFLLAFVFYPVYKWLVDRTGKKSVSSFITILIILFIVLIPAGGLIGALIQETSKLFNLGGTGYIQGMIATFLDAFKGFAENWLPSQFADRLENIGDIWGKALVSIFSIIQNGLMDIVSSVPLYGTYALVAAFFTYYFLIDGKGLIDMATELLPRRDVTARFLMEIEAIYSSLFRLLFVTAAITGVIAAVGFAILGVPYPVLMGILTAVASLLPMVGPPLIFVPAAVYFFILQDYFRAIGILFFGIVFINVIPNNVIFPKLASRGSSIHPLISMLAFTAPILVVGMTGMIIGPAVYGFVLAAFRTWSYFREMKSKDDTSAASAKT